jgi:hypothetical protein
MVYHMEIDVDGGCRGNGHPRAIEAAAAMFKWKTEEQHLTLDVFLDTQHPPTNALRSQPSFSDWSVH